MLCFACIIRITRKVVIILNNKEIFAKNLNYYMNENEKTRKDIGEALNISYYTVTDWVNGKKYPRMDKVELLANYFGVLKSDLIEEKLTEEKEKDNDVLANIIVRLRTDSEFKSVVETIYLMDSEKISGIKQMLDSLQTFIK